MTTDILKEIIDTKNTTLCFSADFTKTKDLIKWIHITGPYICILKTHIDMLDDYNPGIIEEFIKLKKQYNFLILEDRKFADIGKTFYNQLFNGIYKIADWADIITIHGICSDGMLNYISSINNKSVPSILIVSDMSSKNNIIDNNYKSRCYEIAKKYNNLVLGFITQSKFIDDSNFFFMTPGIQLNNKSVIDQQYKTPQQAYLNGSDIIVVGSGIYLSTTPYETINKYLIK